MQQAAENQIDYIIFFMHMSRVHFLVGKISVPGFTTWRATDLLLSPRSSFVCMVQPKCNVALTHN